MCDEPTNEDDSVGPGADFCRDQAIERNNPLFAWERIYIELLHTYARAADDDSLASVELPVWCLKYLAGVSRYFIEYAKGRDPDKLPAWKDYERIGLSEEQYEQDFSRWMSSRSIDPAEALGKVAFALGMSRKGWNGFADWDRAREAAWLRDRDAAWKEEGIPARDRATLLAAERGHPMPSDADERTLRRAKRGIRKRRGKPTP